MKDLSLHDATQRAILPHLGATEALLAAAGRHLSGRECDAEVVAMPDLGLANNVGRMVGGFFTGALYRWDCPVPFFPIDATLNVCSVSLHSVAAVPESLEEFRSRVEAAHHQVSGETSYDWNFAHGNHFITIGTISGSSAVPDGDYLLMHASASEFKSQANGLYPTARSWFAERILTVERAGRILRFITGNDAERFARVAHSLVEYNSTRHEYIAELVAGPQSEQVYCRPHYGMPDDSSVAIGCHWLEPTAAWYVLLTGPGLPVHLVAPNASTDNSVTFRDSAGLLTPHGLGAYTSAREVCIAHGQLALDDDLFSPGDTLASCPLVHLRGTDDLDGLVESVLRASPGRIVGSFVPTFSYSSTTSEVFAAHAAT